MVYIHARNPNMTTGIFMIQIAFEYMSLMPRRCRVNLKGRPMFRMHGHWCSKNDHLNSLTISMRLSLVWKTDPSIYIELPRVGGVQWYPLISNTCILTFRSCSIIVNASSHDPHCMLTASQKLSDGYRWGLHALFIAIAYMFKDFRSMPNESQGVVHVSHQFCTHGHENKRRYSKLNNRLQGCL